MILVTGANGFIGSAMVWELNQRGIHQILACDTVNPDSRPELLQGLRYSQFIETEQLMAGLKAADKIAAVFHMGACSSTTEMDKAYLERNNTQFTKDLWSYCLQREIPFIYASSGATYGDGAKGFSDEIDPRELQPLNPYGWSKLNFDIWALEQRLMPRNWYGLRFFNVYGPNEYFKKEMSSVVYKAYLQIRDTGELKLFRSHRPEYQDGKQLRDFVYVKDITRWMWELYESRRAPNGIYNMGYGQARTWLDLAAAVFAAMGRPMRINWIDMPENIRNQYQYFTEAKMDKWLRAKMSPPEWNLERGVSDYLSHYLLQPNPYLK